MGHAHYAPHNRQWQRHDAKSALPNDRVAGQIEFTSEDQWRDWQLKRDQHDSKYCGGFGKFSHVLFTSLKFSSLFTMMDSYLISVLTLHIEPAYKSC